MEVHFENGGFMTKSDNPQRLRGEGLDFLVMDEAAFVKPEVWREVLRPTLTEERWNFIYLYSYGMNNWFYDLWKMAEDDDNGKHLDFNSR